jgi:hypothetical protein
VLRGAVMHCVDYEVVVLSCLASLRCAECFVVVARSGLGHLQHSTRWGFKSET